MGLPPGSRLPAVAQTAQVVRDPVGFFVRRRDDYGPVFRASFMGVPKIAYVSTPDLAQTVLRSDRTVGEAGTARRDFLEPLVGSQSVLCLEGEAWMRERRLLGPSFHGTRIQSWAETIADVVGREVSTWPRGVAFPLRPRMQRITLKVIWRIVFGLDSDDTDPAHQRLWELLPQLLTVAASPVLAFVPTKVALWLDSSDLAGRIPGNRIARFGRIKQETDALLMHLIARRRADPDPERTDVLSSLASADTTDEQVRDELITLLEAGHETTSTALAWLFERLLRTPDVLAETRTAVESGDDRYLDAVVKESLRIRPVLLDAPRFLTGPLALDGYEVPSGWYVAPVIPLVHADPETYADPGEFRPQRFLTDQPPTQAWIPFGGSRRMCLGIQLAILEMRVVLREVLSAIELHVTDPAPERLRLRGITIVPEHQTRVVASAR
jgi:cytochrome P450 family 135